MGIRAARDRADDETAMLLELISALYRIADRQQDGRITLDRGAKEELWQMYETVLDLLRAAQERRQALEQDFAQFAANAKSRAQR